MLALNKTLWNVYRPPKFFLLVADKYFFVLIIEKKTIVLIGKSINSQNLLGNIFRIMDSLTIFLYTK